MFDLIGSYRIIAIILCDFSFQEQDTELGQLFYQKHAVLYKVHEKQDDLNSSPEILPQARKEKENKYDNFLVASGCKVALLLHLPSEPSVDANATSYFCNQPRRVTRERRAVFRYFNTRRPPRPRKARFKRSFNV